jgi:hypothetical protein
MPSLTGNTAIDVAIGLAFVYLLFSVLCSAVQEAIAGALDWRSATLEAGLRNLLEDDGQKTGGAPVRAANVVEEPSDQEPKDKTDQPPTLTDQVLGHGLMRMMYQRSRLLFWKGRRGPSYIPSRTFSLALLNIIAPARPNEQMSEIRATIDSCDIIPAGTRAVLVSLANDAVKDRDELRTEIEHWYDSAMDRVSGWYKRRTQVVICVLSLIVAVGLNVNTVSIADRLVNDDGLRAALVQSATNTAAKPGETVSKVAGQIQTLGLPIGWNKKPGDPARVSLSDHWGRAIGGWLITFLALSLGAPFWFDALGKIAGLRATGPPAKPAGTTSGSS